MSTGLRPQLPTLIKQIGISQPASMFHMTGPMAGVVVGGGGLQAFGGRVEQYAPGAAELHVVGEHLFQVGIRRLAVAGHLPLGVHDHGLDRFFALHAEHDVRLDDFPGPEGDPGLAGHVHVQLGVCVRGPVEHPEDEALEEVVHVEE